MSVDSRRPHRQDTFDLRDQILTDAAGAHQHHPQGSHIQQHGVQSHEDEEHSVLEDDSEGDQDDDQDEFMDEDDSSSLSIPNETIDFDLVYSLHTFVATVEGQANVVKGDSLFLMDDSNSYWWLVRVLKTQEVGYIPAENIETPYERLARLNKHRNVDLAAATPEERTLDPLAYRAQQQAIQRQQGHQIPPNRRISFYRASMFHYPPAVWNEEEQEGWEQDDYESYDTGVEHALNDEEDWDEEGEEDWDDLGISGPSAPITTTPPNFVQQQQQAIGQGTRPLTLQQQQVQQQAQQQRGQQQQSQYAQDPQQQQRILQQQQQQQQQQYGTQDRVIQQQGSNPSLQQQNSNGSLRQQGSNPSLRGQGSREGLSPSDARSLNSSGSTSPAGGNSPREGAGAGGVKVFDPEALDASETRKISATPTVAREQQYAKDNQAAGSGAPGVGPGGAGAGGGPLLPSAILASQQENDRKRLREDQEEEARKRRQREGSERSSSQQSNRPEGKGKLQKAPSSKDVNANREKEKEKEEDNGGKKKSLLGSLFSKKKGDKTTDKSSTSSGTKVGDEYSGRGSSLSASDEGAHGSVRSGYSTERPGGQAGAGGSVESSGQGHGLRVQQNDMKQQAAFQRYLETANKETAPQPSYGLQSASAFLPNTSPNPNVNVKAPGASVMKHTHTGSGSGVTQFGERTGGNTGLRPGGSNAQMGMGGPGSGSGHQRPGSLILTAAGLGFEGGASVPELSVMRVFAGSNLSTEATFKTVLLNSSTTSGDLVKQAMQRFRVAAGEDSADYYLTVKTQVEGSFTTLQAHEKPLVVFEEMVDANAKEEMLPTIRRSSITSISSLSSNLSMHPAIRRLPMNDFTDDSAVKFYLNRYEMDGHAHVGDRMMGLGGEELPGPEGGKHESLMSMGSTTDEDPFGDGISAPNSTNSNLAAPERFTSSSARFAMQVLIYPDDLPDGMVFDPHTEAIVPKSSLRDRAPTGLAASSGIPQTFRRKVFVFPKNTTVAEVIELGLERFGINEGVVDGGDEVEDKGSKRRSASRVRYGLSCLCDGQEKELLPSSKVLDAFPRPPSFRMADQKRSADGRRRSADVNLLLGSVEDIHQDDPAFILRRSVAYRMNNAPRSRLSAPLDELALSHLRESITASITASEASTTRDDEQGATPTTARSTTGSITTRAPPAQLSRQEIIAAQRAASRANQRAILSAQSNSEQGVDILLPDKATIRSSRIGGTGGAGDMVRYSYIEPDGETYDISEIMEEEWSPERDGAGSQPSSVRSRSQVANAAGNGDLLEGALGRQGVSETGQKTLGEKIDRVLNKIKANPNLVGSSGGRGVSAIYSDKDVILPPPSRPERAPDRAPSRSGTPNGGRGGVRGLNVGGVEHHRPNQASVHSFDGSEPSLYESAAGTPNRLDMHKPRAMIGNIDSPNRSMLDEGTEEDVYMPPASTRKRPLIVLKDHDFGLSRMMAVIEMKAVMSGPAPWQANTRSGGLDRNPRRLRRQQSMLTSDTIVDDLLFGPKIDVEEMHPRVREIYEPVAKRLDALDKQIDDLLFEALRLSKRG